MPFRIELGPPPNRSYSDVRSRPVFSAADCELTLAALDGDRWTPAALVDHREPGSGYQNERVRSAAVQTLPFDGSWPLRKLSLGIAELNAEGPRVDVDSYDVADLPSVVRYEGGTNDHFRAHQDVGPSQSTRKLTFVLQLSDPADYQGGALVFPEIGHSAEMTRGELVVFPSYLRHVVTPVLTGTRLALIGWVHGPAFR